MALVMQHYKVPPFEIGRVSLLQARELCKQISFHGQMGVASEIPSQQEYVKAGHGSGIVLDELYDVVKKRMASESE